MTEQHYRDALFTRRPELEACREQILQARDALLACYRAGGKLLLCGNGGSASDCDHISGELLKGFMSRRTLTAAESEGLSPELAGKLQRGLPAIPLSNFPALGTAFTNDVDPLLIYAQLVNALGRPGDVLIGISTSGNAKNVRAAAEVARARKLPVIALTGRAGGALRQLADICVNVPADETYLIQELHLPVYHYLCQAVEAELFG
ncbi:MAG: SIS domain-containing protein [Opitutaceae bacterium]|jgi:D-sedoheptulose 7-phosphate isomerase|nr:SIS domain-containing protein [Opitutaceae bacterium]